MNRRNLLIAKFSGALAPVSPRFQRFVISTRPFYFFNKIFPSAPVTFLFWHTYIVVKLTLNGGSISAARGFMAKKSKRNVAGEQINDE